eukprot:762611-Hanusia_phi.AAC.1
MLAGGQPPGEATFDAAGYNSGAGIYQWKSGALGPGWTGQETRVVCKDADRWLRQEGWTKPGQLSEWNPGCRGYDTSYNEWYNLDSSAYHFKANSTPVDPGSVDPWLSGVGGGIY